jgi:hypothetical protein
MGWCVGDRVQAGVGLGDGRRALREGEPGTVRRVRGGYSERAGAWLWWLTVEWDSGPGWEFGYRADELAPDEPAPGGGR